MFSAVKQTQMLLNYIIYCEIIDKNLTFLLFKSICNSHQWAISKTFVEAYKAISNFWALSLYKLNLISPLCLYQLSDFIGYFYLRASNCLPYTDVGSHPDMNLGSFKWRGHPVNFGTSVVLLRCPFLPEIIREMHQLSWNVQMNYAVSVWCNHQSNITNKVPEGMSNNLIVVLGDTICKII
jgi:hypothetical protein